ncbi:transcriptional regulator family: Fungal Specific TF [Penicillium brevicompactum]|uniref:transcriptional regulator family: Fungal Specific TF n=1 Tax=Penicillium brevicompactum TaxID=5074 RepID=UPI0025412A68|nr:transcriptional regulator family: Fungal Specific TF [Penicillium brevicompactum]KAJ5334020.1 transcriptional regulator family: Fungal Specific TF [Penicillium brevicompactum]
MAGSIEESVHENPHTRSFTGCATCRSRHVKCDEGQPECSMCQYFGLTCGGYKKDIFFDFETSPGNHGVRFRRPLLTVKERERMSQWLVSNAPPKKTLQILSHIDDQCERATLTDKIEIHQGPFGAFRLSPAQPELPDEPALGDIQEIDSSSPEDVIGNSDSYEIQSHVPLSPWSQGMMQLMFDQPENVPSPPSPGFLDAMINSIGVGTEMSSQECLPTFVPDHYYNNAVSPTSLTSSMDATRAVPQDAVFLLKHYASAVISLMTPFRHSKTPWHVLFIPHTKTCLAALALGDDMTDASLCIFYGTLAISAFSLGGVSKSQTWSEKAVIFTQQAQHHARSMLMTAYDIPKVAKYKSILMALLTMVQVTMFSGNRSQSEFYFLEAEKFIRLRGLKRKKSRKVRLLHHCYVFERIIHESVFICGANSGQRHHVRTAVESSGLGRYSLDSLSFRLSGWKNLHQEMMRVRGQEEGENDLHLERPGFWSNTLYPEIFGIPESWVFLLSQIIRLGKEKDAAEGDDETKCLSLKDFIGRAKTLEEYINNLQPPSLEITHSQLDRDIIQSMLDAMKNALAIYFYRRIHDVDAAMLQQKVVAVLECLLRCENTDSTVVHGSAGFIWPAFIAACEAEDPSIQSAFADWFDNSACRSGLSCFRQTLADIQKIWQEKCCAGKSVTWLDLMKRTMPLQQHL